MYFLLPILQKKMRKKFLIKEDYKVYIINGVTWYRLDKKSPEIRFPKVIKWIKSKENSLINIIR